MSIALVFPGQGSQQPAMAEPWQDHPAYARWAEADELLDMDVSRLGLDATAEELAEPANCQRALFVHHVVLLEAYTQATGPAPVVAAGHSLGEYDALVAAGVLDFAAALRLVDVRARLTADAADQRPGTLVACLGFDIAAVTEAAAATGTHLANDNAPGQVVVAGSAEGVAALEQKLAESGERGTVRHLAVGAAYHSPHMEPAVEPFRNELAATTFTDARVPVVANVDAQPHTAAGEWEDLLARQLTSPVRWRESVAAFADLRVTEVVELGATPVLSGLVKRIDRQLVRTHVATPDDLAAVTS